MAAGRQVVVNATIRAVEIGLIVLGAAFVIVTNPETSVRIMFCWVVLAFAYLLFGGLALRRSRLRTADAALRPPMTRWRLNFLFGLIASLTGVTVALDVAASTGSTDLEAQLEGLGGVAMILSWMLLHASFARQYEALSRRKGSEGGLRFPADASPNNAGATSPPRPPNLIDFLYFAFSVGATFAATDVSVTTTRMRWHVMTHSVISFFYNAAVVAFAIAVLIGR